ncbi:MAG: IS200/IS605 family transposase [Limisphaerales bacterium]
MANTYTQIYIQVVFAVQGREAALPESRRDELHGYMTGVVKRHGQKMLAINSMPDHVHLFVGLKPDCALSSLVRDVKAASAKWTREKGWVAGRFSWQEGFGAFSYSHSQIGSVIRYIERQQIHHAKRSFAEEYRQILERFAVRYDLRYVFAPPE